VAVSARKRLAECDPPANNSQQQFAPIAVQIRDEKTMQINDVIAAFLAYCSRHRAPATLAFYRARLKKFCEAYNSRDLASLTPLEIDEHLQQAGAGMSDSTRHHNAVAVERLQKFALQNNLLDKPVFGILEKSRVGPVTACRRWLHSPLLPGGIP
jgi:hypothetical protein